MHAILSNTARLVGVGAIAAALVTIPVSAASAHVTVSSPSATQGGYGTLNFKVPNESDTASTVKLVVEFPASNPIASASYQPVPGWSAQITKDTVATALTVHGQQVNEAVKSVTWTAAKGAGISQGQFQVFPLSVGPLPSVDSISFNAIQTYSDGTVVSWNEQATPGGAEPEKPAPTLTLAPASDSHSGGHDSSTVSDSTATSTSSTSPVAVVALIVGIVALLLGVVALIAGRKKSA